MFDKLQSEIKRINPRSPIFIGIVAIFSVFFIYLILITTNLRSQQEQGNTTQSNTPPFQPTPTLTPGKDYVQGQIVVKFKDGISDAAINQDLLRYNASVKSHNLAINTIVIAVPVGQEENIRAQLTRDGLVKYAKPDFIMHTQSVPNDTYFANQWGLSNSGQNIRGQTGVANDDIHAEAAWSVATGAGIKVAILDTGIDLNHPDLAGKVVTQRVFITSSIDDGFGHGTHVSGIIAANSNNNQGIAGTCPGCQLMIGKVLDDSGSGPNSGIANAITWAADNGANVISMSLAGQNFPQDIQDAVNYAWNKNVVVVAAAGNCGDSNFRLNGCTTENPMEYPAALQNVVSVANTDNKDQKSSTSNYGSWVKIAAPGTNIFSTLPTHSYALQASHHTALNYDYLTGTSQATPMVAGVAALIWSTLPAGTANQTVVDRLLNTADKITGTGTYWQNGRLDAAMAVGAVTVPVVTVTPAPTFVCEGSQTSICNPTSTPTININPTVTVGPTNPEPSITQTPPGVTNTPELSPTISPSPNPSNPCSGNDTRGFVQKILDWVKMLRDYINQFVQNLLSHPTNRPRFSPPARPIPC